MTLADKISARLASLETQWQRWPHHRFVFFTVIAVLVLTVFFFSPRWWLMTSPAPGSFQWSRGLGFVAQCENPFRADIEPALRWRLLPPLVAHYLGLRGTIAFIIPWLGVLALLAAVASWSARLLAARTSAFFLTLLIATSSAVLVPLHWFGINDAWAWLGLFTLACARSQYALVVAALLCPWIDERFLIGLPLALWCRHQLQPSAFTRLLVTALLPAVPYVAIRVIALLNAPADAPDSSFLLHTLTECQTWLPLARLGWWMALRAAWPVALAAFANQSQIPLRTTAFGAVLTAFTLLVSAILAADLSRSAAVILPLLVVGAVTLSAQSPFRARLLLGACAAANLLIPAAHVVYRKIDIADSLPVELYRLLR
jgi:hypothetical protein